MGNIDQIVSIVLNEMNEKNFFENYVSEKNSLDNLLTDDFNNLIWNIECLKVFDALGIDSNISSEDIFDVLEKYGISDNIVYDEDAFENIRQNIENYFKSDNVELFNRRMSILMDKNFPIKNFISSDDLKILNSQNISKYINQNKDTFTRNEIENLIKLGFPEVLDKLPNYAWLDLYDIDDSLIKSAIDNGYNNYDLLINRFSKTNKIDYIISTALSNGYKKYDKIFEIYSNTEILNKIKDGNNYLIEPFLKKIDSGTIDSNMILDFLMVAVNNQEYSNNILNTVISNHKLLDCMINNYDKFTNIPKNVYGFLKYENENNKKLTHNSSLIRNIDDIKKYFNEDGFADEEALNDLKYADYSYIMNIPYNSIDSLEERDSIKAYIKFMKKTKFNIKVDINEIDNCFGKNGDASKLFENVLVDYSLFDNIFKSETFNYEEYYKPSDSIKSYIEFVKEYSFIPFIVNNVNNVSDINKFFDKEGPTISLFENALINKDLFYILYNKNKYDYENNDKISSSIKKYVEFVKINGFEGLESKSIEEIKEDFSSQEGIKKVIIDLFEHNLFNSIVLLDKIDLDDIFTNYNIDKVQFFYYLSCNTDIIDKYKINDSEIYVNSYIELLQNNNKVGKTDFLAATINYFNKIDTQKFNRIKDIKDTLHQIEDEYGKIGIVNNVEPSNSNSCVSMNFVTYVYPFIKENSNVFNFSLKDLLKYESTAYDEIASELKKGNKKVLLNYYSFIRDNNIFNDDRSFHFAFRHFSKFSNLLNQIDFNQLQNDPNAMTNFKNIILNGNIFEVKTYDELKNYNEFVTKKIELLNNNDSLLELKTYLSKCFGYDDYDYFVSTFETFQLDNFAKRDFIYNSISNVDKNLLLNDSELKVILIAREIIKSNNIDELKMVLSHSLLVDYTSIYESILLKTRKLYNKQFNSKFTSNLEGNNNVIDKSDYKIIDYDNCEFHFLAHRIYSFDPKYASFANRLINNPELWDKLDGASTLSTSSISDKGFWMVDSNSNYGVVYLFNNLPEDFLLYMYGNDLMIEHGGHRLTPKSRSNFYTDLDSLNQSSVYHDDPWNEVAGFREGMRPCAIACLGEEPTLEQINASKYFKVPIIRFNQKKYEEKRQNDYSFAQKSFIENPTVESLHNIFYSGDVKEELHFHDKFYLYFNKIDEFDISLEKKYELVEELRNIVDRICDTNNSKRKEMLNKASLYLSTLEYSIKNNKSNQFSNANIGESGIMYKEKNETGEYLIKPAVDKKEYQVQNYRADIQKAASQLQQLISPDTSVLVEIQNMIVDNEQVKVSRQEMINVTEIGKEYLNKWVEDSNEYPLADKQLNQLLQEYVVDYLLCNFDCFAGNFVIDTAGNVRGVDKEQSFRFISENESLDPSFNYTPNGSSRIPIYRILFNKYNKGDINLNFNYLYEILEKVKNISDEDYKKIFMEYAKDLDSKNYEEILNKIVDRKNKSIDNIVNFIQQLQMKKENESELIGEMSI